MPNTPKGYPYPAPTDPVNAGAAAIQSLAQTVNDRLGVSAGGLTSIAVSGSAAGSVVVTYPAWFPTTGSRCYATVGGTSSSWLVSTGGAASSMTIYVRHYTNTAQTTTVSVFWQATA